MKCDVKTYIIRATIETKLSS